MVLEDKSSCMMNGGPSDGKIKNPHKSKTEKPLVGIILRKKKKLKKNNKKKEKNILYVIHRLWKSILVFIFIFKTASMLDLVVFFSFFCGFQRRRKVWNNVFHKLQNPTQRKTQQQNTTASKKKTKTKTLLHNVFDII